MSWTNDLTTQIGQIRLLIPDRVQAEAIFSDEELAALAELEGGSTRRAAAAALEVMASDEAYVQKALRLLDLSTNGPSVAQALMARAAALREQAATEDDELDGAFDIASWAYSPFGVRELVGRRRYG